MGHAINDDTFACWRMDELPAGSVMDCPDSGAGDRDAAAASLTAAGQIRALGPTGQVVRAFDGSDDTILRAQDSATTALLKTTALTIQCFVYLTSLSTSRTIVSYGTSGESTATNYQIRWDITSTAQRVFWETGSGGTDVTTSATSLSAVSLNTWHHLAIVKNGTGIRFYVDGVFTEQITYAGSQPTGGTSCQLAIGSDNATQFWWVGRLKDLKISDKTYSDSEIATEAALLSTTFELPVDANTHALWRMNENFIGLIDSGPRAMHLAQVTETALFHGLDGLVRDDGSSIYFNDTYVQGEVDSNASDLNTALKLPFTIECWVNIGIPWTSSHGLWVFGDPGSTLANLNFLSVDINSDRTFKWWSEYGTDADDTRNTTYVLPYGRHHLGFRKGAEYTSGGNAVYDVDIFVDGVLEETIVAVRQYANGTAGWWQLGHGSANAGPFYRGQLDDFIIYEVARTDEEIAADFEDGAGIPDEMAPIITNITPAPGQPLALDGAIMFDVSDETALSCVVVLASYDDDLNQVDVVYDGDGFRGRYRSSTVEVLETGELRFTVRRSGNFPDIPRLEWVIRDASGNGGLIA